MEKAIYINKINQFSNVKKFDFDRIYFGEEFCQWLVPSLQDFKKARIKTEEMGMAFTCVTPYFSENGIKKLQKLLDVLSSFSPCEIIVNDWGSLFFIHINFSEFTPIMGRLLTKQRRGSPIQTGKKLSQQEKKYLNTCSINIPAWKKFLKHYKINRIEIDNLPLGISDDFSSLKIKGSIYYPFGYLTTTRLCLFAYEKNAWKNNDSFYCSHACNRENFNLKYPSLKNMKIFLRGNTQIFKYEILPENLSSIGIDRIIDNTNLLT